MELPPLFFGETAPREKEVEYNYIWCISCSVLIHYLSSLVMHCLGLLTLGCILLLTTGGTTWTGTGRESAGVLAGSSAPAPQILGRSKRAGHHKSIVSKIVHEVTHGKIKALLVAGSAFLVFLEVFEEVAKEVPILERFIGHKLATVHHGVFLLTLSHLITTVSEVLKATEESVEINKELKLEEMIHKLSHQQFSTDTDAAMAFDQLAVRAFGRGAATNFPTAVFKNHIHLDSAGQLPQKSSKFRGVVWDNDKSAWIVPSVAFGHDE